MSEDQMLVFAVMLSIIVVAFTLVAVLARQWFFGVLVVITLAMIVGSALTMQRRADEFMGQIIDSLNATTVSSPRRS